MNETVKWEDLPWLEDGSTNKKHPLYEKWRKKKYREDKKFEKSMRELDEEDRIIEKKRIDDSGLKEPKDVIETIIWVPPAKKKGLSEKERKLRRKENQHRYYMKRKGLT